MSFFDPPRGNPTGDPQPPVLEDRRKKRPKTNGTHAPQAIPSEIPVDEAPPEEPGYLDALVSEVDRSPSDVVIADFNRLYMVVNESGRAMIYATAYDPVLKRERYDRMTFQALRDLYLNRRVKIGEDKNGKAVMRGSAEVWLHSQDRRQYIKGLTFDPSGKTQEDGVLNLWKGFAVTPKPGRWGLLRKHVFEVICGRDHERFDYLMGWMARMIQHPDTPGEVAVVLKGNEGTGKGTLANALAAIIGHHSLSISNGKHLTGNFNAHLRDLVFLFADEAFFAGDKASIGVLKAIITEPCLTIEGKYRDTVQVPNFLHVIMASNEEWVVPASLEARRFYVLEVPDDKKGQHSYFAAINDELKSGGYEAMLYDLLAYDLTNYNVRDVPVTEGLQKQKKLSLGTTNFWWMDCLHRGYVLQSKFGLQQYFGEWREEVSTEVLYASYLQFASARRERHPLTREGLGQEMRRFGARSRRQYKAVVGEEMRDVEAGFGATTRRGALVYRDQPAGYFLGSLAGARDSFTTLTHLEVSWEDEEEQGSMPV